LTNSQNSTFDDLQITGDFNIDMKVPHSLPSQQFHKILFNFDLVQHLSSSTHLFGSIIDHVITRSTANFVQGLTTRPGLADHSALTWSLTLPLCRAPNRHWRNIRNYRFLDTEALDNDLSLAISLPICCKISETVEGHITPQPLPSADDVASFVDSSIISILDSHAPTRPRRIAIKSKPPWFSPTLLPLRRQLRKAERQWRTSKSAETRLNFIACKAVLHNGVNDAKRTFWLEESEKLKSDPRALWKELNKSIGRGYTTILPAHDSPMQLATSFASFFQSKVDALMSNLPTTVTYDAVIHNSETEQPLLDELPLVSEEEIHRIIACSNKTSPLDSLPMWLLRKCLRGLLPALTILVNRSLDTGMPMRYKHSIISPKLKKGANDQNELSSYRPVSNLSSFSKIIEKAVASRLTTHLKLCNAYDHQQFAYRRHHSCESAVTNVLDTALYSADSGDITILTLLDLSSAFDTVNHTLLLTRLHNSGVRGNALAWFRSYLTPRTFSIRIGSAVTDPLPIHCGVPQGSVLGPLLFLVYIRDLGAIIKQHGLQYVVYADDVQLFTTTPPSAAAQAIHRMEVCIEAVKAWLANNQLVINTQKTELIVLGPKLAVTKIPQLSVTVGGTAILAKPCVRDLGAFIDSQMSMDDHIKRTCRSAFSYLRAIAKQRFYMNNNCMALLVHSFVLSRLDFCASLLCGITKQAEKSLQRVMNYSIRMIDRIPWRDAVSPSLRLRGWLPIHRRIQFRLAMLVHSVLTTQEPKALASLLVPQYTACNQRITRSSSDMSLLTVPRTRTKLGDRAFRVAGPKLWNSLPRRIRELSNRQDFRCFLSEYFLTLDD
jgi:hypothetical protein